MFTRETDRFRTSWTRLGLHQKTYRATSFNARHYPQTVWKDRGCMHRIYFHLRKFHHGGQTNTRTCLYCCKKQNLLSFHGLTSTNLHHIRENNASRSRQAMFKIATNSNCLGFFFPPSTFLFCFVSAYCVQGRSKTRPVSSLTTKAIR